MKTDNNPWNEYSKLLKQTQNKPLEFDLVCQLSEIEEHILNLERRKTVKRMAVIFDKNRKG